MLRCGYSCRLDQGFIFLVSVLIAFGLSWHVYSSWLGIAINTGAAALVAALGVREVRGLQSHFQRHRWVAELLWECWVQLCSVADSPDVFVALGQL